MNIKIRVSKREFLYFTPFIIWIAWHVLDNSLYSSIITNGIPVKFIEALCIIMLLYKIICCDTYKINEIKYIAITGIITLIPLLITREHMLVLIFLFIIASKNIPFKNIVKVSLIEISLLVLFIMLSCGMGIIQNYVYLRQDGSVRNSLGFSYTLFLGAYYLNIVLMYLYIRDKKTTYFEYLLILVINFYIYKQTDNRTVYLLIYLAIIMVIVLTRTKLVEKLSRVYNIIFSCFVPLCAILSITVTLLYNDSKKWCVSLNNILDARLALGKKAYLEFGLHLFGNRINMVGAGGAEYYKGNVSVSDYNYVDCSFLQIALKYGLIFLAALCISYTILCIREARKQNIMLCICIFIIALQGIINDQFILIQYNTFLLAFSELFNRTGKAGGYSYDYNKDTF